MKYDNLEELLLGIGKDVTDEYKKKLKQNDVYATGKLYNSVKYEIKLTKNGIILYFVAEKYYINVENGRKADTSPENYPPIRVIRKWMKVRGIADKPGLEYAIQRSIAKKGIKARPYLRQITKPLQNIYNDKILEAINKDIAKEVDKKLNEKTK